MFTSMILGKFHLFESSVPEEGFAARTQILPIRQPHHSN
jgi:hypothetical protein